MPNAQHARPLPGHRVSYVVLSVFRTQVDDAIGHLQKNSSWEQRGEDKHGKERNLGLNADLSAIASTRTPTLLMQG